MKDTWTEQDIRAMPEGEHDYFERKAGALFEQPHFRDSLAKAISAFANSGGGHILLGVKNDGSFDGVVSNVKKTRTREHLEQIIPNLVDHPLATFRVHEMVLGNGPAIPGNKVVIVIDVGDSPHAPHQARHNKVYYYRPGGRSEPAPHFYIEALRNRTITPILSAKPIGVQSLHVNTHTDGLFLQVRMAFDVTNSGRSLAQHWLVSVECKNEALIESGTFRLKDFPKGGVRFTRRGLAKPDPLLPFLSDTFCTLFGLNIAPERICNDAIQTSLARLFHQDLKIVYSVVCESTRSDEIAIETDFLRQWLTADNVLWTLPSTDDQFALYGGYGLYCNNLTFSGEGDTEHSYIKCDIENRSGADYLDLDAAILLKDEQDRVLHHENFRLDRLAHGVTRSQKVIVRKRQISGMHHAQFVFISERAMVGREFSTSLRQVNSTQQELGEL